MLERIKQDKGISNYIICTDKPLVKQYVTELIKRKHRIKEYYEMDIKGLNTQDIFNWIEHYPFTEDKWFLQLEIDREGPYKVDTLFKLLPQRETNVKIFYINEYATYMWLRNSDTLQNKPLGTNMYYLGKLTAADVEHLDSELTRRFREMSKAVKDMLKKEYLNNPNEIIDIYYRKQRGERIDTKEDVVKKVGYGDNTVDNLILNALTSNIKTEVGVKRKQREVLSRYLHLRENKERYPNDTVLTQYFINSIKTLIDIKIMYYRGIYDEIGRQVVKDIPKGVNDFGLKRLRQYNRQVIEKIDIIDLLLLYNTCTRQESNVETGVVLGLLEYLETKRPIKEKAI